MNWLTPKTSKDVAIQLVIFIALFVTLAVSVLA